MNENSAGINRFVRKKLLPLFSFEMPKRARYSRKDMLALLLNAGILGGFAEGTSNAIEGLPDADTMLNYVKTIDRNALIEIFDRQVEDGLKVLAKKGLLFRPVPVAIDWFDWMFYGNPSTEMVMGTNRKKGSNYAYEFLTASIVAEGRRIVLGVLPVSSRAEIGRQSIRLVEKIRRVLNVSYLTFDRGFFCVELLHFLELHDIKYVMHLPQTNRTKRMRLWPGRRFRYRTSSHHRGGIPQIAFDVVVAVDEKDNRYLFATNVQCSADRFLVLFKPRWGIETSYRINNQFLPKTVSRNYTVRLFYYLFACLVQNCWVVCKASFCDVTIPVLELKLCLLLGGEILSAGGPT